MRDLFNYYQNQNFTEFINIANRFLLIELLLILILVYILWNCRSCICGSNDFTHINPYFSLSYQCFQYSNLFVFLSLPVSTILFRSFKSDFYVFCFRYNDIPIPPLTPFLLYSLRSDTFRKWVHLLDCVIRLKSKIPEHFFFYFRFLALHPIVLIVYSLPRTSKFSYLLARIMGNQAK